MDSSDNNQAPLNNDADATSFAPDFDMSAVNEAVAAGGEADTPAATDTDTTSTTDQAADSTFGAADSPAEETTPAPGAATFIDGDLADEPAPAAEEAPADPVADMATDPSADPIAAEPFADTPTDPIAPEPTPNDPLATEPTLAADAAPAADATPVEPAPAAESQTIADLANAAPAPAPEAAPAAAPAPTPEAAPVKKSKTPTYILIGLAILAVVSVVIALIVSLGN